MTEEQRKSIVCLLEQIREELLRGEDDHTIRIVTSQIEQILELVARYYALQLSTSATSSKTPTCCHALSICFDNITTRGFNGSMACPL